MHNLIEHAKRFEVDLDTLWEYLTTTKKMNISKSRLKYAFNHKISFKEYRFLYYSILEIDLLREPLLKPEEIKFNLEYKWWKALQAHIPNYGGESSKKHKNTEFI